MTKIFVFKKENLICGFQVKGHSGFAEEGKDIVCSSVSTAAQMTLVGLKEVLKLDVESEMSDGFMSVYVQAADLPKAQDLLLTMHKTLESIAKEYGKFVKLEVKKYVY